ncbi:hypothetical protein M378DRAFT_162764 [Amanita muscaria Koide BX008]|uniref:Uncharacterized protein n=1 Tax=Amanita muscaria (strain Koide BX008) TaxID=946122 RepID=A0A0C2X803_AMAMK|nr:hypothetical protein M378DRAFT_162764 [Amanita muscaria Koide BX008]
MPAKKPSAAASATKPTKSASTKPTLTPAAAPPAKVAPPTKATGAAKPAAKSEKK